MAEYPSTTEYGKSITYHVAIWKKNYGEIPKGKVIHHLNGDKYDYRLNNLICIEYNEHRKLHSKFNMTKKILNMQNINLSQYLHQQSRIDSSYSYLYAL